MLKNEQAQSLPNDKNSSNTLPLVSSSAVNSLPPITVLLHDSFTLLKKSFLSLLILSIIGGVGFGLLVFIFLAGLIPIGIFGFLQANSHTALSAVSAVQPITIILATLLFFLLIVGMFVIGDCLQVAFILALNGKEDPFEFGSILKKSIRLIIPAGIVLLLTSFIVTGGFFLFLLPGIIFSLFLSFALYEVVIEQKRGNEELRESVSLVAAYFWSIVVRVISLWILMFIVMSLLPLLLTQLFPKQQLLVSSLFHMLNGLFSWYALAYMLTLYKQAKAAGHTKTIRIQWLYITAVVGWVAAIALAIGIVYAVGQFINSGAAQEFFQQQIIEQPKNKTYQLQQYNDLQHRSSDSLNDYDYLKEL